MELPETSLLVAFEAIARHRNFRKAADELHLTPSAVSHRLKTLETQVGQTLLIRTTRTVEPTPSGTALLKAVVQILDDLRAACRALETNAGTVTIVTTDSVATCWLIDRLPSIADDTETEIRILTRPAGFEFDPTLAEFAIAYGRPEHWPNGQPLLLADETITPVCSPAMASGITRRDDLWRLPLLGDQNLDIDWPTFATRTGRNPNTIARVRTTTTFNHSHLALRAAANGQGIALAGSPLANDALSRGELVKPISDSIDTGNGYYLVTSQPRATSDTHRIRQALQERLPHLRNSDA